MRIFLISNMYPSEDHPSFGIFVRKVAEGLELEGAVFSAKALIRGKPQSFPAYIASYLKFLIHGILGIFKKFDIIYCHYILHSAPLTLIISFFTRKPLVINIHGTDLLGGGLAALLLSPFRNCLLKKADLIIVPSKYFKLKTMKITGLPENIFFVSPSGGVPEVADIKPYKKSEIFILGYIGRIVESKGIFLLLDVAAFLKKNVGLNNFKILVAGDGPDRNLFFSKVTDLGLSENFEYLGHFDSAGLSKVYQKIDLLIFPTLLEESLGLVGLEAMAHGKPIVATEIGGITDYLIDGENGFFIRSGDIYGLCEKIIGLYNNPSLMQILSQNALSTARNYTDRKVSENLYKKLIFLSEEGKE